ADGKESALMSQDLSRIVTDMPLEIKLEEMEYGGAKREELRAKLEELGFKSLVRRIWGEDKKISNRKFSNSQMGLF
ncbi:MAG: hypothetical protein V1487_03740, partial [bacterium]